MAAPKGKVIDAYDSEVIALVINTPTNHPQQCVVAHRHHQAIGKSRRRSAAERQTKVVDDCLQPLGAPGSEGVDTIADFSSSEGDMIAFRNAIFHLPFPGSALDASAFRANATSLAEDTDDRLIYNTTNGELSYDSDGIGKFFAFKLAVLTGIPTLTAANFEQF